jgi:hypothetical protein
MHVRLVASILLVVFCLIANQHAFATSVVQLSLREMAEASHSIVHGTVITTISRWNEDRTDIVTDVVVQVLDVLKGEPVGEVVVTQPGGRVGKVRVDVDGAVAYRPGDEAILFLRPAGRGKSHVTGLFQGRFEVVEDVRSGEKVVRGLLPEHVNVLGASKPGPEGESVAPLPGKTVALDRFLTGMRGMIEDIKLEGGK